MIYCCHDRKREQEKKDEEKFKITKIVLHFFSFRLKEQSVLLSNKSIFWNFIVCLSYFLSKKNRKEDQENYEIQQAKEKTEKKHRKRKKNDENMRHRLRSAEVSHKF